MAPEPYEMGLGRLMDCGCVTNTYGKRMPRVWIKMGILPGVLFPFHASSRRERAGFVGRGRRPEVYVRDDERAGGISRTRCGPPDGEESPTINRRGSAGADRIDAQVVRGDDEGRAYGVGETGTPGEDIPATILHTRERVRMHQSFGEKCPCESFVGCRRVRIRCRRGDARPSQKSNPVGQPTGQHRTPNPRGTRPAPRSGERTLESRTNGVGTPFRAVGGPYD